MLDHAKRSASNLSSDEKTPRLPEKPPYKNVDILKPSSSNLSNLLHAGSFMEAIGHNTSLNSRGVEKTYSESETSSIALGTARKYPTYFEPSSRFGKFMITDMYETMGGVIVLLNFLVITIETHARAVNDNRALSVCMYLGRLFLVFFVVETSVRLYMLKLRFFSSMWNNLDLFIVLQGLVGEIMEFHAMGGSSTAGQMGILKSLRMIRLVRLLRLLLAFRELYILIVGFARCMKTLCWAAGLIFMALNVWSILSVEFLSEVAEELDDSGEFGSCNWCRTAFSNIWLANLTWFQIVSGDGWSNLARRIIEKHPWTYLLFVSNIFIVMWGLLNLIVAAILESSIQAREDDVSNAAKMRAMHEKESFEQFAKICEDMDADGNGHVTVREFKDFLKTSSDLRDHLTIMGVQDHSLEGLLQLMDEDGNGVLDAHEFVAQFTRMRTLVLRTEIFYLVKYVENIEKTLHQQGDMLCTLVARADARIGDTRKPEITSTSCESLWADPFWFTLPIPIDSDTPDLSALQASAQVCHTNVASQDGPARNVARTIPDGKYNALTETFDKRFDAMRKRLDQLPREITNEVVKHICMPLPCQKGSTIAHNGNIISDVPST